MVWGQLVLVLSLQHSPDNDQKTIIVTFDDRFHGFTPVQYGLSTAERKGESDISNGLDTVRQIRATHSSRRI